MGEDVQWPYFSYTNVVNNKAKQNQDVDNQPVDKQITFEQAIGQLENLIEKIESGEVGLEEALKHYESGSKLIKHCRSILDVAEKRISELTIDEKGDLREVDDVL